MAFCMASHFHPKQKATDKQHAIKGLPGDLGEDRTLDPLIKSQLLYQLSYEVW
jgi:hypothetical protein